MVTTPIGNQMVCILYVLVRMHLTCSLLTYYLLIRKIGTNSFIASKLSKE